MDFIVGATTDQGRKRSQNQDSFKVLPELGLAVVADGMGGHRGGETASRLAADVISERVSKELRENPSLAIQTILKNAIQDANRAIFELATKDTQLEGMGTTTTALLFKDHSICIGQVGDSRCYLLRNHGFWQTTRDHSLVQEKFRAGLISREQIKIDQMRNVITRSVGFEAKVEPDMYEIEALPGDLFLLCSDGLSGLVDDAVLCQMIDQMHSKGAPLQEIADALVREANQKGGDDNITSIVAQVT